MDDTPLAASSIELFDQLADLPRERRLGFLETHCSDPGTRAEVLSLIDALDDAGEFLSESDQRDETAIDGNGDEIGMRIGPYGLLELLGEGGFARVYRARQSHPVQREVALKLIKLGMDTRAVIARFELERQALARMDHPNIAAVYDAGVTETGRPYFVMELVRGSRITQYCEENQLGVDQRLRLFVDVCLAAHHAHTKGIIHRDLKPSNVLVATVDEAPLPKIIDFGIAKAVQQQCTEATAITQSQQLLGTPQYMSPEQAVSGGADVDTRSDVYSLGAILYELLAGVGPLDPASGPTGALRQLQRLTSDEELPPPSARATARRRRALRGELDCVVGKCLEKDRGRRYESAAALAADLQAVLDHRPIVAAPPSSWYRVKKFARRNTTAVIATGVVAAILIAGSIISTVLAVRATRAEQLSEQRAQELRNVALTFMFDIDHKLEGVAGTLPGRVALLDAAGNYLEQLRHRASSDRKLMAEISQAYNRLGDALNSIGRKEQAAVAFDKAVLGYRTLYETAPVEDVSHLLPLANSVSGRASTLRDLGRNLEQVDSCRQMVDLLEQAARRPAVTTDPEKHRQVLIMIVGLLGQLSASHRIAGQHDLAIQELQRALTAIDQTSPELRGSVELQFHKSGTLQRLGEMYVVVGSLEKGIELHRAALELLLSCPESEKQKPHFEFAMARAYARIGHNAFVLRRFDEAVENHRKQLEIRRRVAQTERASTVAQRDLARSMRQLSLALLNRAGPDLDQVEPMLDDAITLLGGLTEKQPGDLTLFEELAETHMARAYMHQANLRWDRAVDDFHSCIRVNRQVLAKESTDAVAKSQIAVAEMHLAELKPKLK